MKSPSFLRPAVTACCALALAAPACSSNKARAVHRPIIASVNGAPDLEFVRIPAEQNDTVIQGDPATGPTGPYRLEIEDVLDISIYGEQDLQHVEVLVRPDGMISFAFIGDVQAAGRTVEEVRQDMTGRLAAYLRSPQVTVIAKQFAQKKVYVGGEVRNPGILYLTGKEGTLLDAMYKAGLVTDRASLEEAYIMRGNKIVAADFKELVRGNLLRNVRLMDQDMIYVPESANRYVYVLGRVRTNQALEVTQPIPIIQAIARSGGFDRFAKTDSVAVVRGGLKDPRIAMVDAKELIAGDLSQNIMVQPGDIVWVGLSGLGKYNEILQQILTSIAPIVQGVVLSNTANP
ncbi:MAG TPA: polysaccharide biosynthesis/export family protein [Candidatus Polarisedimenticolia bacterium]|nr:polysaccharide biosynthesis/export family protein [Candidatus Polarisedimenticolia bacterium]